MNCTRRDIEIQFARVIANGWLKFFQREARRANTTTAHLLALGSRETNLKNIKGDFRGGIYHGYGILQIDIGTNPDYCRHWSPNNVEGGIEGGIDIYLSKIVDANNCVGKHVAVRSRFFTGKTFEADDLRRIATSAYNCGRWSYYHFSRGENVDSTTTGHDYSRDVYDRAIEFADILEQKNIEPNAVENELTLQGKYARQSHRERFNFLPNEARVKLPVGLPQESAEELEKVDYERNSSPNHFADLTDDEINLDIPKVAEQSSSDSLPPDNPVSSNLSVLPSSSEPTNKTEDNAPPTDAPPATWLHVEDWKPWVFSKLKWVWSGFSGTNLTQFTGNAIAAVKSGENWWIFVIAAFAILLITFVICGLISLVLLAIWYFNRKEIVHYITLSKQSLIDSASANLGLKFVKIGGENG